MLDERLAGVQRLLVIQLDAVDAVEGAIATLQQQRPDISLVLLKVRSDDGYSVSYVLPREVPLTVHDNSPQITIEWIREQRVDGAIVFAGQGQSPYTWAYRCYLAGVPVRIGISGEFGGQVLSHCIAPPNASVSDVHLYLLQACGLLGAEISPLSGGESGRSLDSSTGCIGGPPANELRANGTSPLKWTESVYQEVD